MGIDGQVGYGKGMGRNKNKRPKSNGSIAWVPVWYCKGCGTKNHTADIQPCHGTFLRPYKVCSECYGHYDENNRKIPFHQLHCQHKVPLKRQ